MNPDLNRLHPYPFEKLRALTADVTPAADKTPIAMGIGEPKHAPPPFVLEELITHVHQLENYPLTKGSPALRAACSQWLAKRFHIDSTWLDPERNVLPVNGTREALFAFAQVVVDRTRNDHNDALVIMPNPFYQIYEGAAILAGAQPWYLNTLQDTRFLPDFTRVPNTIWERCQLVYICSPGNPSGAVMSEAALRELIELADRHDFIIAADECYSELYFDEDQPPPGLLQAAAAMGRRDFARCVVFHSLSKRSNLPGLRSGFVAGDADILEKFLLYRTYHGCSMAPPVQAASIVAWEDEKHVRDNRDQYRQKFAAVLDILSPVLKVEKPDASFYLWPETPIADTDFARELLARENVSVVPGRYLSRETQWQGSMVNPGVNRVRMALVAPLHDCIEAARRIRHFIEALDK